MCKQCKILQEQLESARIQHEMDAIVIANRNTLLATLIDHIETGRDISALRLGEVKTYVATRHERINWQRARDLFRLDS